MSINEKFTIVRNISEIPSYSGVLSGDEGEGVVFEIPKGKREHLVVLQRQDKSVFILGSMDLIEKDPEYFYSTLQRLADRGLRVARREGESAIYQGDSTLIDEIYRNKSHDSTTSEKDKSDAIKNLNNLIEEALKQDSSEVHIRIKPREAEILFRIGKKVIPFNGGEKYTRANVESMIRSAYNTASEKGARGSDDFSMDFAQFSKLNIDLDDGRKIEIRYQSTPRTPYGAKINLRLLSSTNAKFKSLIENGYEDSQSELLNAVSTRKNGLTLFCGETGSGKTTSLHVLINEIITENPGLVIHSIEDPVEIVNPLIDQMPLIVKPGGDKGAAYVAALHALLRSDPDIIYQGEIRTEEQAKVSAEAVMTGHGMISSIHTQGAIDTLIRLNYLGLDYYILGGNKFLNAVIYQSLFDRLCPSCSIPITDEKNKHILEKIQALEPLTDFSKARTTNKEGCEVCTGGAKGKVLCAEIFVPDNHSRDLIRKADIVGVEDYWANQQEFKFIKGSYKGKTFLDHCLLKVSQGVLCPYEAEKHFGDFDILIADRLKEVDVKNEN